MSQPGWAELFPAFRSLTEEAGLSVAYDTRLNATVRLLGETIRLVLQGSLQQETGDNEGRIESLLAATKNLHEAYDLFAGLVDTLDKRVEKVDQLVEALRNANKS